MCSEKGYRNGSIQYSTLYSYPSPPNEASLGYGDGGGGAGAGGEGGGDDDDESHSFRRDLVL